MFKIQKGLNSLQMGARIIGKGWKRTKENEHKLLLYKYQAVQWSEHI